MDELLELLENNARISLEDLAKVTGRSQKEVASRIKKYEKKGIILRYKTLINKNKLREEKDKVLALIEVKITPQKDLGFDYIAERIYKFEEVKTCYLVSGTFDLLLVVEGKDIQTVANFVAEKLAPLNSVRGTTTHFLLKKYKEDGVIFEKTKGKRRLSIAY